MSIMKKLFFLATLLIPFAAFAQDLTDAQKAAMDSAKAVNAATDPAPKVEKPKYWTTSYGFDLGVNQTALINWAAGGYNTASISAGLDVSANYAKDLTSWNNRLQLDYGFMWSQDKPNLLQKSKDRIYLESKFGYKTAENSKWNYTASLNFRSQFSDNYENYTQDASGKWQGDLKSGFLSPAYTDIALGMEWKPNEWFNLNLAPLTGGITAVMNPMLRENYGMPLKDSSMDPGSATGDDYKSYLFQFGAQVKANVMVQINDKFKYETQLVMFYDYLYNYSNPDINRFPVRVNWDNSISWTPVKFFKIGLSTWLIYDPLVKIKDKDGVMRQSLVQFKEFLSVNFTYTFVPKKK